MGQYVPWVAPPVYTAQHGLGEKMERRQGKNGNRLRITGLNTCNEEMQTITHQSVEEAHAVHTTLVELSLCGVTLRELSTESREASCKSQTPEEIHTVMTTL